MRFTYIVIFLIGCLTANGQDVSKEWLIQSFNKESIENEWNNWYHSNYHVLDANGINAIAPDDKMAISRMSSIISQSGDLSINHKTITPSGHIMVISTINNKDEKYTLLTAIRKDKGQILKEFEYFQEISSDESIPYEDITTMRDLWQKHSNNNRPDLVVKEVYASDAYYLNRGNLLNDTEKIIKEYGYMLHPSWSIELVEAGSLRVSKDCVIELGTYAEGRGQYLLIWHLQPSANWKIFLDFNF
ncbi:MAG: hypothetical protein HKN68_17435 [Saprospiraceae bacterium]|nr:hypothetical protein [Saprospiraceae bacterium]